MTIRKRLIISNVLMIVVPVIWAGLAGLLCLGIIWLALIGGAGVDVHDAEDFSRVSLAITEAIEHCLDQGQELSAMEPLLESTALRVRISQDSTLVYTYGPEEDGDAELAAAAQQLTGSASVSQEGQSLYKSTEQIRGQEYTIVLLTGNSASRDYGNLKAALVTSGIFLAFVIFLSILLTNRFLTGFVFRRIRDPLEILTDGVHQIRDGNLDFRIRYDRPDEFLPVCQDFNEMAGRLKASVEQSQRQERSRRELLAGISHDIRTPLTSIQAYVEGLMDGVAQTTEARERYLAVIKAKAEDLERMVSQLFLLSKLELGDYPEAPARLRLDEQVAAAIEDAREEYQRQGLVIQSSLAPAEVTIDPVQLKRLITNIMGNSLKYKSPGPGLLRITLAVQEQTCLLAFDDDGPGVPEEALPRLFEVFYRSDPARQNPHSGSGLGLAIVSNIVTHAGGRVCAEKSKLGGLRIAVQLPLAKGAQENG